jgi:7-cyano-7-deazaguanine reductase
MPKRTKPSSDAAAAAKGLDAPRPAIECFPCRFPGTEVAIEALEFTSVCPKTGLPDFGTITVRYEAARRCIELKSFKYYLFAFRNVGVFYENAVNVILRDVVRAARPRWALVRGDFSTRGGIRTTAVARWKAPRDIR